MTAHWSGERPEAGTPLEFGVKKLWFTFAGDKAVYEFKPVGELFFSDWKFDIFSPDGAYVLLLQDGFGPYHVIRTTRLKSYLQGKAKPYRSVRANDYPPHAGHPAKVHSFVRWVSNHSFEFTGSCCGDELCYRYHIPTGRIRSLGKKPIS